MNTLILSTPLITWGCIVCLFILIVIIRLVRAFTHSVENHDRIVDFASEREEFFLPGDPDPTNADIDYEDFDDL